MDNSTIIEFIGLLRPNASVSARDGRSENDRNRDRMSLGLALQDGNLNVKHIRKYAERISPETAIGDIWQAKEHAYGVGSTDPREVAEVYGWGGWQHQQAELSHKERIHILESQNLPRPPIEDPEYLRDLLRRYNIDGVTIKDDPDISYATEEEVKNHGSDTTAAWSFEKTAKDPHIRLIADRVPLRTREEIENTLAHEFVHTLMDRNTAHGPMFMDYVDSRNISVFAPSNVTERLGGGLVQGEDTPRQGRVPVHMSVVEEGKENNPKWVWAQYWVLAEPGETELRNQKLEGSSRAYLLPGSAMIRSWPETGRSPPYWEIGTVEDDGTIQWDCLTYGQPDQNVLTEYVRLGYCPPRLQGDMVRITEYDEEWIQNVADIVQSMLPDRIKEATGSNRTNKEATKVLNENIQKITQDHTTNARERVDLIEALGNATIGAVQNKENIGKVVARTLEQTRNDLIQSRVQSHTDDPELSKEARLANPDRELIAGAPPGLPYGASPRIEFSSLPIGDVSAWPRDRRMDNLQTEFKVLERDQARVIPERPPLAQGARVKGSFLSRGRGKAGKGR